MSRERDPQGTTSGLKLELPAPTASFRRRAWLEFQRALNPLAALKELPRQLRQPPQR